MAKVKCKICKGIFEDSTDSIVVCNHIKGPAHLGCCSNLCSMHGSPCENSQGIYEKTGILPEE